MAKKVEEKEVINCLRNEKITVRFIPKVNSKITDPRHALYGGMSENAKRTYVVPRLSSGKYVNVLTNDEKAFLEEYMDLEPNALSVHKVNNNFWDDTNPNGIGKVTLGKRNNYLDLSDPNDYIRYKILLANKDFIAPSLDDYERVPKATYQYVIVGSTDDLKKAKSGMNALMECYKLYGKIEEDKDVLSMIIEIIDGRPVSLNSKLEMLQTKINELIQADSKKFLSVIKDEYLETKVLIKKSLENGTLTKKGNYIYFREDGQPLCENNEEPTLNVAAKYLNSLKHQDLLFSLQAKLA